MGCVSREHPLTSASMPGAQKAASLAEAPDSAAAIYPYASRVERDRRIAQWLAAMELAGSPPVAPTRLFLADWQNNRWSYPGKRVVHAMFPEDGQSGKLCLVRVDLNGRPEALAALNNWCMDSLGLWAD